MCDGTYLYPVKNKDPVIAKDAVIIITSNKAPYEFFGHKADKLDDRGNIVKNNNYMPLFNERFTTIDLEYVYES